MALLSDEAVPHHLVGTSSSHRRAVTVATSAVQPLVEVIKAVVPALKLLNTEGLVECVLGFLLNVRAEVSKFCHVSTLRFLFFMVYEQF